MCARRDRHNIQEPQQISPLFYHLNHMFGEVGVVTATRGVILLLGGDYGMVMEGLFGLRAIRWKEVENVFFFFLSGHEIKAAASRARGSN